jgi:hypothetical protein
VSAGDTGGGVTVAGVVTAWVSAPTSVDAEAGAARGGSIVTGSMYPYSSVAQRIPMWT